MVAAVRGVRRRRYGMGFPRTYAGETHLIPPVFRRKPVKPARRPELKCRGEPSDAVRLTVILLGAAQILAGTGVDLDLLALVDEQGDTDNSAGLQGSGLGDVGSGIAADTGLGLGDF